MMIWLAAAMAAMATAAPAQTFPERTVKLVVPVPPGGSTDAVSRLLTARLQAILGQPVIIENQPGAGGVIAARAVAAAEARRLHAADRRRRDAVDRPGGQIAGFQCRDRLHPGRRCIS